MRTDYVKVSEYIFKLINYIRQMESFQKCITVVFNMTNKNDCDRRNSKGHSRVLNNTLMLF